jgi:hypothetical protein
MGDVQPCPGSIPCLILNISDAPVQVLTELCRQFEAAVVAHEPDYIAGTVQDGCAMTALPEVIRHRGTQLPADVVVNVVGQLTYHVLAVHNHARWDSVPEKK